MSASPGSIARPVVVKIGTSSLVGDGDVLDASAIAKLAGEVAAQVRGGRRVVVVSSGAVAAGRAATRVTPSANPAATRALSAIGQPRLMRAYEDAFGAFGLLTAQVLISLRDFGLRRQYLRARETIETLWTAAAVPIVNENDALLDGEVRFGDNDRLAALVANLVGAEVLVILTDTPGLYDADPRRTRDATLVEEVAASDAAFDEVAGGPSSPRGTGGMGTKLAAARLAAWSGVRAVIAEAIRKDVVAEAVNGKAGVGTTILTRSERLPARKAWIAFALPARAKVLVDDGARRALVERDASLLSAGVRRVEGRFEEGDAVEICDLSGAVFAKGLARVGSLNQSAWIGKRSGELGEGLSAEVVHKDDLVVLEASLAHGTSTVETP
jgi:glutamate 5-kinase